MRYQTQLEDWQEGVEEETSVDLVVQFDRIDIEFGTGAQVWIEYEDGRIRVHCYDQSHDEPVNVEIFGSDIEVWHERS